MYVARYEELKGKRVLITGAASGIGLATAQVFANHGAKVFVVDYNKDAVEKVMAENPDFAGYSLCDVSKEGDVEAAFAKMDAKLGGIDVLISNAGISIRAPTSRTLLTSSGRRSSTSTSTACSSALKRQRSVCLSRKAASSS